MYLFSPCKHLFVDTNQGSLTFHAEHTSHGEMLDGWFIVPLSDAQSLISGKTVTERPGIAAPSNFKPKTIQIVNPESENNPTIVLRDPTHLVEINGRKKLVVGELTFDVDKNHLNQFLRHVCIVAFFELSMNTIKTSKDRKKYAASLQEWTSFTSQYDDPQTVMLEANRGYYSMIPKGILP